MGEEAAGGPTASDRPPGGEEDAAAALPDDDDDHHPASDPKQDQGQGQESRQEGGAGPSATADDASGDPVQGLPGGGSSSSSEEPEDGQIPEDPAALQPGGGGEWAHALEQQLLLPPDPYIGPMLEGLLRELRDTSRYFLASMPAIVRLAVEAEVRSQDWELLGEAQRRAVRQADCPAALCWGSFQAHMVDRVRHLVAELPKAWAIGGDGGMGDIGFQNVSKAVLQNRPNVKLLMLDTQVYSNTGGQNSDSSVITGGFDMNQIGAATQGKLTEKKSLAEIFTAGHGSPFVAQVSMANAPKLYKALLDALEYRGTAYIQSFTPCQPEHGVGDDVSTLQAQRARDCRLLPEFTFHPGKGETYREAIELKGNPAHDKDWWETTLKSTGEKVRYTVAHYAVTEARFRQHVKKVDAAKASTMAALDDILVLLTQDDVVHRRVFDPKSPVYVPDFGVVMKAEDHEGKPGLYALSRQMVLLCVERRKAWRLLQSKAGVDSKEYRAQRALLARLAKGEISRDDVLKGGAVLLKEELAKLSAS